MALNEAQRAAVRSTLAQDLSRVREPIGLTKPEVRAAINATDDWIEANAAAFNAALPEPAKTNLTGQQKVRLFMAVAKARFEVA